MSHCWAIFPSFFPHRSKDPARVLKWITNAAVPEIRFQFIECGVATIDSWHVR
jgi:hypothetical protein